MACSWVPANQSYLPQPIAFLGMETLNFQHGRRSVLQRRRRLKDNLANCPTASDAGVSTARARFSNQPKSRDAPHENSENRLHREVATQRKKERTIDNTKASGL
jgi:hypothetical protein